MPVRGQALERLNQFDGRGIAGGRVHLQAPLHDGVERLGNGGVDGARGRRRLVQSPK